MVKLAKHAKFYLAVVALLKKRSISSARKQIEVFIIVIYFFIFSIREIFLKKMGIMLKLIGADTTMLGKYARCKTI